MIAHVQQDAKLQNGASMSLVLTGDVAGNTIVVCTTSDAGHSVSGITDTEGNTYTRITGANGTATGDGQTVNTSIWYAKNIVGSSGTNTVVVIFTGAGNNVGSAVEYSGIDTTTPVDTFAAISNSTSALVGPSLTITNGGDLLVTAGVSTSTEFPTSVGAPWTAIFTSGSFGSARPLAELIAPGSPGTYHVTYSGSSGAQSCSSGAAFFPTGGVIDHSADMFNVF